MILVQQGPSSYKKKNTKKRESFIIINNDNVGGVYIHNIVNTLVNSGLQQQDLRFRGKRVENIKHFDAIVVGDCDSTFDYDFRVVKHKHQKSLNKLDGRSFKVYNLVKDYEKILRKIKAYARANQVGEYKYYKQRSRYGFGHRSKAQQAPFIYVYDDCQPEQLFMKKDVCSFKRLDPIHTQEKATFFSDWVKIGMHQFDIEYDCLGNEFIEDGARNKYYIGEDRYGGRRFLVTR